MACAPRAEAAQRVAHALVVWVGLAGDVCYTSREQLGLHLESNRAFTYETVKLQLV